MKWTAEATRKEARRLVEKWQARCGLSDMDIEVKVIPPNDMLGDADARFIGRADSMQARLLINRHWWKDDGDRIATPDLELNIVHELRHTAVREMTAFVYAHLGITENAKSFFRDIDEQLADRDAIALIRWDRGGSA